MITLRKVVVGSLALIMLLAGPSASAAPSANQETTRVTTTIEWTLQPGSAGGCPQLATEITAVSVLTNDITVTHFPDGSRQIVDVGRASGHATDPSGRKYHYDYRNRAVISVPAEGTLVIVADEDSFKLRGGDRSNRVDASFNWLWTYQTADLASITGFASVGVPTFSPDATNWVQLSTVGDPLLCDPI
jgi:hypothetical protein